MSAAVRDSARAEEQDGEADAVVPVADQIFLLVVHRHREELERDVVGGGADEVDPVPPARVPLQEADGVAGAEVGADGIPRQLAGVRQARPPRSRERASGCTSAAVLREPAW